VRWGKRWGSTEAEQVTQLPGDGCLLHFQDNRQEVDGDTVTLTVASEPGTAAVCAQLTDMREEIPLDVDNLDPGEYTLVVNEEAMTTFTVPQPVRIQHRRQRNQAP
jgi:hypothetical protein